MFQEKIINKISGIITYGITPPKITTDTEKLSEIASIHTHRINNLGVDALVVYDLQDEAERTNLQRPFPFIETIDSNTYANNFLDKLETHKIIYRCVGKYSKENLNTFLNKNKNSNSTIFVGAATKNQVTALSLREAYTTYNESNKKMLLGGVAIPERHVKNNDEHIRLQSKVDSGCSFFISQAVYNVENAKNMLSDYYFTCKRNNIEQVPILFTLSPCGSEKTLQFMEWLGIDFPRWLENELINSNDILESSLHHCIHIAEELYNFCSKKNIPIGFNIESVSMRKVEIEASVYLTSHIKSLY